MENVRISPLIHNILSPDVRFLRDKRLFEINEVEITGVDCIWISVMVVRMGIAGHSALLF